MPPTPPPLDPDPETSTLVNTMHNEILSKNQHQFQYATSELEKISKIEAKAAAKSSENLGLVRKVFRLFVGIGHQENVFKKEEEAAARRKAALEETVRRAEAGLRAAKILVRRVEMVSRILVVARVYKVKLLEDGKGEGDGKDGKDKGMLIRVKDLVKVFESSGLGREVEAARLDLGLRSLGEVAREEARGMDIAVAKSAFLRVEGKWNSMKVMGEWKDLI